MHRYEVNPASTVNRAARFDRTNCGADDTVAGASECTFDMTKRWRAKWARGSAIVWTRS
jgi:hypothetical protein